MHYTTSTEAETKQLAAQLASHLKGGELIQLVGDVGAGKTTFVKGLAEALGVDESVQSPSFTISRVYEARDGLRLVHYDFYRLETPGILAAELEETLQDPQTITIIEWAAIVEAVLPKEHLTITLSAQSDTVRIIDIPFDVKGRVS